MCGTERLSAKPGTAASRKLAFFWQQKKACKENCRCCECSGPRLRGCTPLRTPIRKSEGPMAKRTQYYCPFLTPSALPPLLSREFPRTPAGVNSSAVGAAYMPPATYRGNPSTGKGPGCRPPSPLPSATRLRQSVGAGHARPAASPLPPRILCITAQPPIKITCLRPLAGRLFFCFKFFSVPFLLRKGINPRLVKITSGQSPQPRRPAPAGPAGSARPSGR